MIVEWWVIGLFRLFFFFQAEDGIRDAQESRGLGDVYKRQALKDKYKGDQAKIGQETMALYREHKVNPFAGCLPCLLYTSDAADDLLCVDLGGRRNIKKKQTHPTINLHDPRQTQTSTNPQQPHTGTI